jgi:hypothetical protein
VQCGDEVGKTSLMFLVIAALLLIVIYGQGQTDESTTSASATTTGQKTTTTQIKTTELTMGQTTTDLQANSADSKLKWDKNGHYYEIAKTTLNWNEAKSYAESQSFTDPKTGLVYKGHLATITSPEENSWVVQNLVSPISVSAPNAAIWLGGYQEENSNNPSEGWHWTTGEPWSWVNWSPREPNHSKENERYLEMWGWDDGAGNARIGAWNDEIPEGWKDWVYYILMEYEPIGQIASTEPTTTPDTTNPPDVTAIVSGDVTISNLDTTPRDIKYEIYATRNGRTFSNARVYIDDELVGRTASEGFYESYKPLPIGTHTITVVYNPLPLTDGGDADITTPVGLGQATEDQLEVGDIGMGSLVPMEDKFFGGAGRVEVTEKPLKFAVNLRIIIQAKPINKENVAAGIFDVVSNFLPGSTFNPFNLPTPAGQTTKSNVLEA